MSRGNRRLSVGQGSAATPAIHFYTLVTSVTCLRAWQSDYSITMGGTPLASGTSPPVVTLTGQPASVYPLRIEIQTTGARGAATFRYGPSDAPSTGAWIEQNVVTTASYAAHGAAAGVAINFPAGSYTNDNVYQATASNWGDEKNSTTANQASAGAQPRILRGVNGRPKLTFDGSNDILIEPTLDLASPPVFVWGVINQVSWVSTRGLWGASAAGGVYQLFQNTATPDLSAYAGTIGPRNSGAPVGTPVRVRQKHGGSVADYLRLAATNQTGTNTGTSNPGVTWNLGSTAAASGFGNVDLYACLVFSGEPSGAELTALDTAVTTWYAGGVGV